MSQYNLPSDRVVDWTPGTYTGVIGGIPTDRSSIVNVNSSYNASGSVATTTGDITSGTDDLVVADASTFAVGHNIRVWRPEIQTVTITSTAGNTGYVNFTWYLNGSVIYSSPIDLVLGDSASVIAGKIRTHATTEPMAGFTVSGSGADIIFTSNIAATSYTSAAFYGNTAVVTLSTVVNQAAAIAVNAATITNKVSTALTLSANATATASTWVVSHDDAPAIQAALNAATAGQIVYCPSDDYRVDTEIAFGAGNNNVTLRGAGKDTTTFTTYTLPSASRGISAGISANWSSPASNNTITAGQSKGSTRITIGSTTGFGAGQLCCIFASNQTDNTLIQAGAAPTIDTTGYLNLRKQHVLVTVFSSTQLDINPPLYDDYDGATLRIYYPSLQGTGIGLEDFTLDCSFGNVFAGIQWDMCENSWVKNVRVTGPSNYGMRLVESAFCEIRKCDFQFRSQAGSNGGGIEPTFCSAVLIEDNIVEGFFPLIEVNYGTSGSVIAYNFLPNPYSYGVGGVGIDTNHTGGHNQFNLYEGNVSNEFQTDCYFMSVSDDTFFRNWLTGTTTVGLSHSGILNRFTRNYNLVGNMFGKTGNGTGILSFGNPNAFNGESSGTAQPTDGDFWIQWKLTAMLTTRTSDSAGVLTLSGVVPIHAAAYVTLTWNSGANRTQFSMVTATQVGAVITFEGATVALPILSTVVEVWAGNLGFQEIDLDVEASTTLKANWYRDNTTTPAGEVTLGGDTLADSLFRASKPAWFGDRPWPAYDAATHIEDEESIPAGYRYNNNGDDPPSSVPSYAHRRRTTSFIPSLL